MLAEWVILPTGTEKIAAKRFLKACMVRCPELNIASKKAASLSSRMRQWLICEGCGCVPGPNRFNSSTRVAFCEAFKPKFSIREYPRQSVMRLGLLLMMSGRNNLFKCCPLFDKKIT